MNLLCYFLSILLLFFSHRPQLDAYAIDRLIPIIISKIPHQLPAYTQGLSIEDGQLYESTGLYGQSSLRRIDLDTGKVLQHISLPKNIFGEGLAVFPDQLFLITWKENRLFIYDRRSFKLLRTLYYRGEGWGLCRDGQTLWMTNGSSLIYQRDQKKFSILKTLKVKLKGKTIKELNDLECVGDDLYVNVWKKNWILRIDKKTGEVTGFIDLLHLLSPEEKDVLGNEDKLNGIAFHPSRKAFFVTGKNWPWIFEVKWMPAVDVNSSSLSSKK